MKTRKKCMYSLLIAVLIFGTLGGTVFNAWGQTANDDLSIQERLKNSVAIYSKSMHALVDNDIEVIDPENELITPFIQNGRILVPVRFIAEAFGAKVSWNQDTKTATIVNGGTTVKIGSYSAKMTVDGHSVELDVPAMITGGRTFIPARALAEALGKKVFYSNGLVVISNKDEIFDPVSEKSMIEETIAKINTLPVVGRRENLIKLLGNSEPYRDEYRFSIKNTENTLTPNEGASADSDKGADSFSTTNIQVEGVDEADIVKTDGSYIYQVSNQEILIYKAYPTSSMELVSEIRFSENQFVPLELYIKGDKLLVIGSEYSYLDVPFDMTNRIADSIYPIYDRNMTKVFVYDVSDRKSPNQIRELSIQGNYISSRLIGDSLYFLSNQYINNWSDPKMPLNPEYMDSVVSKKTMAVPYEDIRYIPPVQSSSYLMVAGVSIGELDKPMKVSTYLGAGEEIYVSQDSLYVTVNEGYGGIRPMIWSNDWFMPTPPQEATLVYKFALKESEATYQAKGQVPGRILNQFSVDENNGYFRIATTIGQSWMSGENYSTNNVYILNNDLNVSGKLENLAKGETIYSVRFVNDRGYIVTFRNVDPLFVINLEDPKNPEVLGSLKIPGYSDYLQPYDENHIIGFGKDSITVPVKDSNGKVVSTASYYMGMKIALFDVSDVANPVQKFSVNIGDRGTDSEVLHEHKALLFDKDRELLAFPVDETKIDGPVIDPVYGYPNYGDLVFSGAYVYNIDLENGFVLKGKISHLTRQDYLESGYYNVDYDKQIKRMLYIDNVLYGVSNNILSAYDLSTLKELATIKK